MEQKIMWQLNKEMLLVKITGVTTKTGIKLYDSLTQTIMTVKIATIISKAEKEDFGKAIAVEPTVTAKANQIVVTAKIEFKSLADVNNFWPKAQSFLSK